MDSIKFEAPEYQEDGSFNISEFRYQGDEFAGWEIIRKGKEILTLGAGYRLVKTVNCGICSTDLARRFLPYPLPQVIGHEVVGVMKGKTVVSEINASHATRGMDVADCAPCRLGMDSHCPDRVTLGIDRLPGGFAPFFLAPVNGIKEVPATIPTEVAALTEPLAAALQAVKRTPPLAGDEVAVLGPRRLGALVIAALAYFRRKQHGDFTITALTRHANLKRVCLSLGADRVVEIGKETPKPTYHIVYDTSGTPEGFASALGLAKRAVHLKSTHGQATFGVDYLTEMVVDEIGLIPFSSRNLTSSWLDTIDSGTVQAVYAAESVSTDQLSEIRALLPNAEVIQSSPVTACNELIGTTLLSQTAGFSQFDVAVVTDVSEINHVLRPWPEKAVSLLRPRGNILLIGAGPASEDGLLAALTEKRMEIHTSRCGDFNAALHMLEDEMSLLSTLQQTFITHRFPLGELEQAFRIAADSRSSIKVMIGSVEAG